LVVDYSQLNHNQYHDIISHNQVESATEENKMAEESRVIKYLQKLSLFQLAPPDTLLALADCVQERSLSKDEILLRQGDPGEAVYIVRFGWLQVEVAGEQEEGAVVAQCGPNEVIGEMSLVDPQPCPVTVRALSPVQLYELQRTHLLAVIQVHPILGLELARHLGGQVQALTGYLQKATEWSQAVGNGEYNRVMAEVEQVGAGLLTLPDHNPATAAEWLTAVTEMTKKVKQREESLRPKEGLSKTHVDFNIEIDELRRQAEVEKLAQRTFFGRLKTATQQLRQRRNEE
jgi:CRP-like cAMP-binding protein